MLPLRKHWHNAPEQAPEREARLLARTNNPQPNPLQPVTQTVAADLNPDGTPVNPESGEATDASTNTIAAQTRADIADAIQGESAEASERLSSREVADAMKTMRTKMDSIRDLRRGRKDVGEFIRRMPEDQQGMINNAVNAIDYQWEELTNLESKASKLADWKEAKMRPWEFRQFLATEYRNDPRQTAILAAFDREAADPAISENIRRWDRDELEQESVKDEIVQQIWDGIEGDMLLQEMQDFRLVWEKWINAVDIEFQNATKELDGGGKTEAAQKTSSIWQQITNIRKDGFMGIGLYTPSEYFDAFKKVWQAFTEAKKEAHDRQANKLAAIVGGTVQAAHLPYGEQINRRLGSILESEFGNAKNEYKEELGDDSFPVLLNKFHQVKNDPPKAIAVLEVAAGHGWLYDISDLSDEQWPVHIFGVDYATLVPSHWDEDQTRNYLGTLTRQNTGGGKEQRQKGYDRIKEQQDPGVYIRKFGAMLDSHDYWQAIGIGDALLDRGKMTEASEYLTAKFIHHLRNNKEAAKYMNKSVLEQFSILKWNEGPTFSQNMIAMNMDAVQKLRTNPDVMEGSLLSNLDRLEKKIRATDPSMSNDDVLKTVAKVLSGQTVILNNEALSIYTEEYRSYWDESQNALFGTYKGQPFASKFAVDYYAAATMMQMPTSAVKAIYTTGSTGQFGATEEIALNFAGRAIERLDELRQSNPTAAEVFRTMMAKKFRDAFEIAFTKSATENLHKYRWKQGNVEKDYMLADLIYHGFLKKDDIVEFARGKSDVANFLKQLDEQLAALGRGERHTAVTPAAPSGPPVNLP